MSCQLQTRKVLSQSCFHFSNVLPFQKRNFAGFLRKIRFDTTIVAACVALLLGSSCSRTSVKDDLSDKSFELINQTGEKVVFPEDFLGSTVLVGYVYTRCPDICPMITYNMRDVSRELQDNSDLQFISISFDPVRDTPEILAEYAEGYKLNLDNWTLLTGNPETVDKLLERLGIAVQKTPTRFTEEGEEIYFLDHTDRVSLIDSEGKLRNNYYGSELDTEHVLEDIKKITGG